MSKEQTALLRYLAAEPFNGATELTLQTHYSKSAIRVLAAGRLIERFDRNHSNPAGLVVPCYRITATGKQAVTAARANVKTMVRA